MSKRGARSQGVVSDVDLPGAKPETLPDGRYRSRTKSFVRRGTRMAKSLENTWETHSAQYMVDVERAVGHTSVQEGPSLDYTDLFGRTAPVTVEIGCGSGDQIVAAAARWPERDFIGLEVWRPGIAKTISKAVEENVTNLRLIEADAVQVFDYLIGEGSLAEVWTFFPDPWRKSRHHKRRLVQPKFAQTVASRLVEGGVWRLATDWDDYAWHMRDVVNSMTLCANPHEGERPDPLDPEGDLGGFAPRFSGRVMTRFEQRGLDAGRRVRDLTAIRLP
ncbi:tRNA (guanosine(46)-N7)-methyltransferase TrmB [Boudabousia marimammalium]|uniref:tRNA (guanine-N(7)-)-methyltransferase n=1 Tax=Boudabousia marimammalium TaxID=156892 RepID=A0A1Q5PP69_9ACTO|nr:tRNA (guanosine(46)-N7)-methyltransferase TrmB [Boudabousia marimammalium]OKL49327.1 tRNA (guanosine(46)-N7)-methyltransferase TrmB [Boudabousia marimammalium]